MNKLNNYDDPPSYDSLFKKSICFKLNFINKIKEYLLRIPIIILIILQLIFPIISIIIGSLYIYSCPVCNVLPIFIISFSIANIISIIFTQLTRYKYIPIYIYNLSIIINFINFILFIFILVYIYNIYEPNYNDINNYNYCNKTFYLYSIYYMLLLLLISIIIIYMICFIYLANKISKL